MKIFDWLWTFINGEPYKKPNTMCTEYGCISSRNSTCGGDFCYKHCIMWHTTDNSEGELVFHCGKES